MLQDAHDMLLPRQNLFVPSLVIDEILLIALDFSTDSFP